MSFISGEWEGTPLFELLNGKVTLNVLPSRLPGFQNCPKYLTTSNNIGLASAGRISSKISDFGGEHSAGRIRHFQAWEFEENKGKSAALMIYIKVTLYAVIYCSFLRSRAFPLLEMFWSTNQNKLLSNHCANLKSHEASLLIMKFRDDSRAYGNIKKKNQTRSYEPFLLLSLE